MLRTQDAVTPRPLRLLLAVVFAGCAAEPDAEMVRIQDIHGLALDPDHPTRLYVATHHGLFVAENDTRWAAVTREPFDMMGFTMHPEDGRVMYASGHPGRGGQGWAVGVVKSVDGGRTWTTLALRNEVDFHAMAMEAGSGGAPDTIYGYHGGKIHVSRDGGVAWTSKAANPVVAALSVSPSTGDVWAATDQGLHKAPRFADGEWQKVSDKAAVAVAAGRDRIIAYFALGGLQQSVDAGASWIPMNWTVPPGDYPWGIAASPETLDQVYVGTARGAIFKTNDGGTSWRTMR